MMHLQRAVKLSAPACTCSTPQQPLQGAFRQHRVCRPLVRGTSALLPLSRCRHITAAQQDSETKSASSDADEEAEELRIERQLERRWASRKRRPAPAVSPVQKAAEDAKFEPSSQAEAYVLQFLGLSFVLIILEGLALAASGFLPEAADAFIVDRIYPTFSAQLGVLFACSTVYGLWKTTTTQK